MSAQVRLPTTAPTVTAVTVRPNMARRRITPSLAGKVPPLPFYLPSYSPELNPDERLNADLKYAIGSKVAARTAKKVEAAANVPITMVAANPERVKSYFQDPRVKYAA